MKRIKLDLLEEPRQRLSNNQNWLCMITGDTGSGKSWLGLTLAEKIQPGFTCNNVAFSPQRLIELIETLPPQSVILVDEAGPQFSAREFMTKKNRALSHIFQAFRFRQIAVIWTLPDMGMMDISARRLMHTFIQTVGLKKSQGKCVVKWYDVKIDRWTGKEHRIFPRTTNGVIKRVEFPRPSKSLTKGYEKMKAEAFQDLMKDTKQVLGTSQSSP